MSLILVALTSFACTPTPPPGPPPATAAAPPPATAPALPAEAEPPADAASPELELLTRLERAQARIRDFQARIDYQIRDEVFDRTERRLGRVVYDASDEGRRLGILLETLIIGQRMEKQRKDFVFDGGWLVERDHAARLFQKRQIVPPGKVFDPLKLGEGPFPLPIGQRAEEVLARFEVELLERPSDEALVQRLGGRATEGLRLAPKPGTELAKEFKRLELFYDARTLLPVAIDARERDGRQKIVFLSDLQLNEGIDPALLAIDDPDPREWEIDIRPWQ